ncbi:MAG: hypothetical protein AAF943_11505 [Pseudomonadota bacterium]
MVIFEDLTDVQEWLEPMGYIEIFEATAPYRIFSIAERDHCDALIASGKVQQDLILKGLKNAAYLGLRNRLALKPRYHETIVDQSIRYTH